MQIKNLKINQKKLTQILVTGGLTISLAVGGKMIMTNPNFFQDETNNQTGYENFNPLFNTKVKANNFVILNMGNHEKKGVLNEIKKMQYANEFDISLGIVINSNFERENEIYDDVEFVKGLMRDFNINFPVYINIDSIITNDDLNVEAKAKLIKNFLEKCSANNMYVGVSGTDTNLTRMYQYLNIREYDAYLIMDKADITYPGVANIIKDMDNNITASTDLTNIIETKNLNKADNFAGDGAYLYNSQEDIQDIAMRFGMSVNELLNFNEIKRDDLKTGIVLRIPSLINSVINDEMKSSPVRVSEPLRGADVSFYQNQMNYDLIKENFDFLIVRLSQGLNLDSAFEANAKNCALNNIPMGVYTFNNYRGIDYPNKEEYRRALNEQADFVIANLKNKKVDYPVYLDLEVYSGESIHEIYSPEDVVALIETWNDKITAAGYIPGLYSNRTAYDYITSCLGTEVPMETWVAGGPQYMAGKENIDLNDIKPIGETFTINNRTYTVDMTQVTDSAVNSGAGNGSGHVDVNFSYIDYANKEEIKNDTYYFNIKEFNRKRPNNYFFLASALGLSVIGGTAIYKKNKQKQK